MAAPTADPSESTGAVQAWLRAQITVYAAELNVVRARKLSPRSLTGEPLTGADEAALRSYAQMQARHPDQTIDVSLDAEASHEPAGSDRRAAPTADEQ